LGHGAALDFTDETVWPPLAPTRAAFDRALQIDSSDLTATECEALTPRMYEVLSRAASSPLIRKVHDAWVHTASGEPLFPPALTLGAVYIVRDPRDVAISLAAHFNLTLTDAIAMMADPDAGLSSTLSRLHGNLRQRMLTWSGHVESWLDAPARVLLVRYEQLLAQPETVLAELADFLGWSVSAAEVAAAARETRFEKLRMQEEQHGFREKLPETVRFFRRGLAGGWRDSLSADQVRQIERDHGRVMRRLGYDFVGESFNGRAALVIRTAG
jgi:hypothetical protein